MVDVGAAVVGAAEVGAGSVVVAVAAEDGGEIVDAPPDEATLPQLVAAMTNSTHNDLGRIARSHRSDPDCTTSRRLAGSAG